MLQVRNDSFRTFRIESSYFIWKCLPEWLNALAEHINFVKLCLEDRFAQFQMKLTSRIAKLFHLAQDSDAPAPPVRLEHPE
ncbi:hypothetical protein AU195_11210 [Mycobacterium sp. IS-1496]|nr:hypothetical protein AU195_11210 [Mycobacterium sp. IS-1496]